jgi:hypothetical protein
MAVTFTVTKRRVFSIGDRKMVIGRISAAGATTVGGDVLAPSLLGLNNLTHFEPGVAADAGQTSFFVVQWDETDNKIAFVNATAAVGAAVPLAQTTATIAHLFSFMAIGKGDAVAPSE